MTNTHVSGLVASYAMVVVMLAGFGLYAADRAGMLPSTQKIPAGHALFTTEMAYYDLPHMTVAMASGGASSHVRLDISIEIASKDMMIVEGYQPRMTDGLNRFLSHLRPDQIARPNALPWLRAELLKQVNSVGSPAPVHDLTFRQFVVM
jgi:flagellar basal body-associated protein FliL